MLFLDIIRSRQCPGFYDVQGVFASGTFLCQNLRYSLHVYLYTLRSLLSFSSNCTQMRKPPDGDQFF